MKNIDSKIKKYTFVNSWEIEYKVGRNCFRMAIETEDLETVFESDFDEENFDTPQAFLESDEEIEKLLMWFHNESGVGVEPMDLQFSVLHQAKTKTSKEVIFQTNIQKIGNTPATIEMTNPAYIQAIVERMERMEREVQKLQEESKRKDDILLTTKMIEMNYQISAKTINQARAHNRIVGHKINGKEWAYEKREVDRYLENSKNYFKNPPQQYAS